MNGSGPDTVPDAHRIHSTQRHELPACTASEDGSESCFLYFFSGHEVATVREPGGARSMLVDEKTPFITTRQRGAALRSAWCCGRAIREDRCIGVVRTTCNTD